jgi:hypothetical protein
MGTKHSPGPWKWWYDKEDGKGALVDANGESVVYADHRGVDVVTPEDARLIAKTPEMAQMLRELEFRKRHDADFDPEYCPMCGNTRDEGHAPDCKLAILMKELP